MYVCAYVLVFVYACVCVHVCMRVCTYVCVYGCVHAYTHTYAIKYVSICWSLQYRGEYLGVYAAFGTGQIILTVLASYFLAMGGVFAAILIHKRLLMNILRLPMSFFDTTPSGRILNRFSKDINTIDETIPNCIEEFLFTLFIVINTIVVISYATPWFMIIIIPLTILYLLIQVSNVLYSIIN